MSAAPARRRVAAVLGLLLHNASRVSRRIAGQQSLSAGVSGPPRVAVLCDAFIRYGTAQAVGLREAGAEVTFYFVDRLGEFDGDNADRQTYLDRVTAAGIDLVPLPQRSLRRLARHVAELHRDLAHRGIEALVVHQHIDPRYATLGLRFPVALLVHDPRTHSGDYASTYPPPVRAIARFAEATAGSILVHSGLLIPQLRSVLARLPVGIVPHGADIAPEPAPVGAPPMLALVGRLMPYKGVDTALEAFRVVVAARPDCTMVVAGRGPHGRRDPRCQPAGCQPS